MAVYRFRVFIEDDHEVYRDVEVQGRQRFVDLHRLVVESFNFQQKKGANYISSDQSWHEGDSVVDLNDNLEGDHQKIVSHIFDPHQRFLCHTESYNEVWLALELQKILKEEEGVSYPRRVKSEGSPPYYTQPPPKPIADEEDEGVELQDIDPMFDGDGPSEEEIERFQKEASAADAVGKLKAPEVDLKKLQKRSAAEGELNNKDEGFEEFDVDDLM